MKLTLATKLLLAAFTTESLAYEATSNPTSSTTSLIEGAVGNGCRNSIDFHSVFLTDAGDICSSCEFCEGSHLNGMFNPHIDSTCIQCASAENSCNTLKVVTSFQHAWIMEFITLASSAMEADSDPNKIIVEGSEDLETWNELYNSDLAFTSRKKGEDFVFSNHKSYKSYSIKFERKAESTKMNVGTYGVVQSYAKACTSNIHGRITGKSILPYSTMRPTEAPTNTPTNAPSPWVLGAKYETCDQACNSLGLSCNAQKRTELNTWEKMRDAFKLVGVTCDPSWPEDRPYPDAPYTNHGHDITKCAFQRSGFQSSCSEKESMFHMSLCYCE